MEILELTITNYRPYRDVSFDFRSDSGHIHIVEGSQGAGKTSFQRAVQWVLYGDVPSTNYRSHLNNIARDEGELAKVEMKLRDERGIHIIERSLESLDKGTKKASEELRVIENGESEETGSDAQSWINERIPEELKDFFFLDGEEIQERIYEGSEIKEDIETVLKHTAILQARDDLKTLKNDRYEKRKRELEEEIDERAELNEKITEKEDKISELRKERDNNDDELQEAEEQLEEMRELLSERNDELMSELEELDEKIPELHSDKNQLQQDLQTAYEELHLGILDEAIESRISKLESEEQELEQKDKNARRGEILQEIAEESKKEGTCLVCGSNHIEETSCVGEDIDLDLDAIQSRLVDIKDKKSTLADRPEFDANPSETETKISDVEEQLSEKKDRRDEIKEELGGVSGTDKTELEGTIGDLEDLIGEFEGEIESLDEEIEELEQDVKRLTSKKAELAGNPELDELEEKIGVTDTLLEDLTQIREKHIQRKREKIKEEMNKIFEMVSRSEFIREKYREIDFKGDPHQDDEYVLQLIRQNGEPKNMVEREPSAGETQLTALSFIFGLNKYANYSATIVFDTVAGRLDLANSEAQGEFFASLDDPIILLVHDAELQKLQSAIENDIGRHYKLRPDKEKNQTITAVEEVKQ